MHRRRMHGDIQGASTPKNGKLPRKHRVKFAPAAVAVNFCPQCGCDLHRVAMGMVLASRIRR